jgi:hypothetical protein
MIDIYCDISSCFVWVKYFVLGSEGRCIGDVSEHGRECLGKIRESNGDWREPEFKDCLGVLGLEDSVTR